MTKTKTVQATQTSNIGCAGFLDEDGDGVCDRCNGAVCPSHSASNSCAGFLDENGDGVCDRCSGAVCSSQSFCAPRKEEHHGGHHNGGHH